MDEDALHAAAYLCRPSITNTRWYILGVNLAAGGTCIYTCILGYNRTQCTRLEGKTTGFFVYYYKYKYHEYSIIRLPDSRRWS